MEDNAAVFWENVKQEIKRQNTTQDWVAKQADISFDTFAGWIAKSRFPRLNEGVRIACALNTSVEYLITGSLPRNSAALAAIRLTLAHTRTAFSHIEDRLREIR